MSSNLELSSRAKRAKLAKRVISINEVSDVSDRELELTLTTTSTRGLDMASTVGMYWSEVPNLIDVLTENLRSHLESSSEAHQSVMTSVHLADQEDFNDA